MNGDGQADVIVGTIGSTPGRADVHHGCGAGPCDDFDGDGHLFADDCDDADPDVHPGAEERCNGLDDDCDGSTDGGAADASTWYADEDGDGYTHPDRTRSACDAPAGYVAAPSAEPDCDDTDAGVHPGAAETAGDGVDQDCDGADLPPSGDPEDTGDSRDAPAETPVPEEAPGCGCASAGRDDPSPVLLLVLCAATAAAIRRPRARAG